MEKKSFFADLRFMFSEAYFRDAIGQLSSGQKLWLDIMLAVLAAFSFVILYFVSVLAREAIDLRWLSKNGRASVAQIASLKFDSSKSGRWTDLTYKFKAADGQIYEASARRNGHRHFQNAKQVSIVYDIKNPRRSAPVFDMHYEFWSRIALFALACCMVLLMQFLAYRYFCVRRALARGVA